MTDYLNSLAPKYRKVWTAIQRNRARRHTIFDPAKSALLVIDMQEYFLADTSHACIPGVEQIIPNIERLIQLYRTAGLPVLFTRHLNTPGDAGLLETWWHDLILETDPLSEISPRLLYSGATVLRKTQYDAFYQTPLEQILQNTEARQVVITGVMSHLCCETTARSAFVRGFNVFFTIDGTATDSYDFHFATLLTLSDGFATLVFSEEVLDQLKGLSGGA
jgi:bifunctional isochorismate lyase/aryl carrier protein